MMYYVSFTNMSSQCFSILAGLEYTCKLSCLESINASELMLGNLIEELEDAVHFQFIVY